MVYFFRKMVYTITDSRSYSQNTFFYCAFCDFAFDPVLVLRRNNLETSKRKQIENLPFLLISPTADLPFTNGKHQAATLSIEALFFFASERTSTLSWLRKFANVLRQIASHLLPFDGIRISWGDGWRRKSPR